MLNKIILLFLLSISVCAQISYYSPTTPKANDSVIITYNPFIDSSKFSINDELYAIIWKVNIDGNYSSNFQKMIRKEKTLNCKIAITEDAAFYAIHFISLSQDSWDTNADLKLLVVGNDGNPVRNAHCMNMDFDNYESEGKAELKLYPDNYAVFRSRWMNYSYKKPDQSDSLIKAEFLTLDKINETSVEMLYAKVCGNYLLNKNETALGLTHDMLSEFPRSYYTYITLTSFLNKLENSNDKGEIYKQLTSMIEKYIMDNKELSYAWEFVESRGQSLFSDSCIQKVCEKWIELQPDNPSPYYLAGIVNNKRSELSVAEQYLQKASSLILEGKLRLYSDISGRGSSMALTGIYYFMSDIKLKQKRYSEALQSIKACQTVAGNPYHMAFQMEGNIWFELKNYNMAEKAYLEAFKMGLPEARKNIQNCYEMTHNSLDGFELYLSSKLKSETDNEKDDSKKAPTFNIANINNVNYSLENLNGKVIVMNFWFTGCGPCKQEIPALNELVKKYQKDDVVFLALALDDDLKILNSYLKKNPFSYVIIPKASQVAKDYKVTLYPTQIVIDKNGNIVSTLVGGNEKVGETLSAIIDNLLRN